MTMKGVLLVAAMGLFGTMAAGPAHAQGVDKLYILDCGQGHATDRSLWSPGVDVNVAFDVSDNCYLVHHTSGYLLWDTGVTDAIADKPEGMPAPRPGATAWKKPKTLAAQLAQLGVAPADIRFLAVSHTHPDHAGNVELFPQSMLLVQKAEYDWPNPLGVGRFKAEHPVTKLEGDHDVFGDGSATIIATPGHTPGHQSLMVRLPNAGVVLLSGDAVHFKANWDNRGVPSMNVDKDKTLASLQRLSDLMTKYHAQLWINHDAPQSKSQKHAPEFYD
jgi:N-acyl homoserine lactone hydrolase